MTQIGKATANPTKAFFVRTITRDISLEDCVLDLLDNSVDGAWQLIGGYPITLENQADLSEYKIEIEVFEKYFRILDNCGGITLDEAKPCDVLIISRLLVALHPGAPSWRPVATPKRVDFAYPPSPSALNWITRRAWKTAKLRGRLEPRAVTAKPRGRFSATANILDVPDFLL